MLTLLLFTLRPVGQHFKCIYMLWFVQQDAHNNVVSPPKPPRAHEWKLLVKNIRVTLNQEEDAAGTKCLYSDLSS